MATERTTPQHAGRRVESCRGNAEVKLITVYVQPTTGGEFKLQVSPISKVSTLKSVISNKLKVPRDKIVLLQKNLQLVDGTLEENQVSDGARLILVPCVEAGLLALRPEHSVLKALNTLTDTQVDNVLMGRVPLNLTMRLGGHMMFIQLQLATVTPPAPSKAPPAVNPGLAGLPTPPSTPTNPESFVLPPSPPDSPQDGPNKPPEFGTRKLAPTLSVQPRPSNAQRKSVSTPPPPSPPYHELAEASRNLTQTLKQISSVAMGSNRPPEKCEVHNCSRQQNGAVIESLYHHGKGIYSGTFVGTLSPSLQDLDGRPRQNISTIVHIINDLLGASLSHPSCCCQAQNSSPQPTAAPPPQQPAENAEEKWQENQTIKGKIEQIQTMMEERRQRRKARREVRSCPYFPLLNPSSNQPSIGTANAVGDSDEPMTDV